MEMKHVAIFASFLIALSASLVGLKDGWHEALTPAFVGGMIGQIGTILLALYTDAPKGKPPMGSIDPRALSQINQADNNQKQMGV